MDFPERSHTPQDMVLSQPSQSSQPSPSISDCAGIMLPPPPRSSSLSLLQTPKSVRIVEGVLQGPNSTGPSLVHRPIRSSSIPSIFHTPGNAQRTPYNRTEKTPGTPAHTPGKAALVLKPTDEICTKLAALGGHITPEQLKNPTYEVLHPVFQAVVRVLVEPGYELNDDNEVSFIRDLTEVVTTSGFQDFTILDLLEPESKRIKRILSAIINFYDFRTARLRSYEQALCNVVQHRNLHDAAVEELNQLRAEVANLEQTVQANQPKACQVKQETEWLVVQLRQRQDEKAQVESRNAELQARLNDVRDHNAHMRCKIQELREEISHLSQGLVQSPARIKKESEAAREQLECGKAELQALDERCISARIWLDQAVKTEKILDGFLEQLKAIDAQKSQWKALKAELRQLQATNADRTADEELARELERLKVRQMELSSQWNSLQDPESLQFVEPMPVPRVEQEIVLQDQQNHMNEIMQQINDAEEAHKADVKQLMEHLAQMEQRVREFCKTANARLQSDSAS